MYKIPKKENVELKQIKLKGDAVEFRAVLSITDGEQVYENPVNDTYVHPPHKDLVNAVNELKTPFAKRCGLIDAETLVTAKDFNPTPAQKEALKKYLDTKMHDIKVTGVALSGDAGRWGAKITGMYKGQAVNTSKIFIGKDTLEIFENDVRDSVDKIIDEFYQYAFCGKMANLEGFDPAQTTIDGTGEQFNKDMGIDQDDED